MDNWRARIRMLLVSISLVLLFSNFAPMIAEASLNWSKIAPAHETTTRGEPDGIQPVIVQVGQSNGSPWDGTVSANVTFEYVTNVGGHAETGRELIDGTVVAGNFSDFAKLSFDPDVRGVALRRPLQTAGSVSDRWGNLTWDDPEPDSPMVDFTQPAERIW